MKLKGLSAIVTGSTSGIGLSIATELAKEGCNVMINGHRPAGEGTEQQRKSLEAYGVKCVYFSADLGNPEEIRAMVKAAESAFGQVDILVNNAGIQFTAPTEEFPDDKWNAIIATDLSASFYAIKAVLPGMQQRDFGRIINIASAHGLVASVHKVAYVSAKHGMLGMTKVVGLENAEKNITCNAVCPGWVDTPLVRKQIQDRAKTNGTTEQEEEMKLVGEKQPNKRFSSPEAISKAVLYFADPDNRYTTGTHLSVDGGWTIW
ncbi:3-hydroxybutyrate dehydrogenase [[Phormidium] sp. ETS-05]|uniref:3-hydroxybutyrate dehydrogenase n=1 Tax=[Phormidium] sp. ETS-05 TaxID=222819 RepID=UPI0018EEE994|nr:3-hydroxybutyrate dehydrogenase [[Phormidium] sp. ETS-05]